MRHCDVQWKKSLNANKYRKGDIDPKFRSVLSTYTMRFHLVKKLASLHDGQVIKVKWISSKTTSAPKDMKIT